MDDTERTWLEGLRRGDPAAFDAVYAAYRPRVYGFLLRVSRRPELADELLQDVFVQLARHATRLQPDTRLTAWLFTVARNRWRSHQRWSWLDGSRLGELASRAFTSGERPETPFEVALATDAQRRLDAGLAALPPDTREVAVLVLSEHLEHAEIAAILGISVEASRQRWSRARARLAEAVGGDA